MREIVFLLLSFLSVLEVEAQNHPDSGIFTNPVLVNPNPPKAVKGWNYVENFHSGEPVLIGEYPGRIIKFPFKGTAVGIAIISGPDAGTIEFSLDDEDWKKQDLFLKSADGNQLTYLTLESKLKNKKHILQLRLTGDKNPESQGTKCVLRYFYFNREE